MTSLGILTEGGGQGKDCLSCLFLFTPCFTSSGQRERVVFLLSLLSSPLLSNGLVSKEARVQKLRHQWAGVVVLGRVRH